MEKAMTAAFGSKEIKKLKVKGHEFNVKPVKVESTANGVKVSGQLSHHRSLQDDDQVYYSFTIRSDGTVEAFDVTVEKSLMSQALRFAWNELKSLLKAKAGGGSNLSSTEQGLSISSELEALEQAIKLAEGKIGTGGWEKASAAIIANVMLRANASTSARGVRVYDRVNHLRRAVEREARRPAAGGSPAVARPFGAKVTSATGATSAPLVRDQRRR